MKRIISLFAMLATICTLFTSVAFAAGEGRFYWEETASDATSKTLTLYFETTENCSKIQASFKTVDALAGGVKISEVSRHEKASVFNIADNTVATTKQVISITLTDTDISMTGKVAVGSIKFDFADATIDSFTLPQAKAASVNGATSTDKVTVTNDAAGYTVTKPTTTPTAKAAVAGKAIEDGFKTFSTDAAIEFAVDATPTIEISKTGKNSDTKLTETLGSGVIGEGKTKIIPIVSYKIGRHGVEAGDIFTIKVTNGTDTSSWTYTVPTE